MNGLYTKITSSGPTGPLLTKNPNGMEPQRLSPAEALTCDQNHGYTPEQQAFDGGKMDQFITYTQSGSNCAAGTNQFFQPGLVLDYYDGNTVTALWNYAQNFAMSDNNYDTDFGPSTPGALNVISGIDGAGYAVSASATTRPRPRTSPTAPWATSAGTRPTSARSTATSTRPTTSARTTAVPPPTPTRSGS